MILAFATQKGGTGKTTLAIAFANYLVQFLERNVKVYDLDFQKSFYDKWREDEMLEEEKLYDVKLVPNAFDFFEMEKINEMKESETINIFDLGGTLDDSYTDLLAYADFIVIPFEYSDVSIKSTVIFVNYLGISESNAEKIFIKSRYDKGYNYPNEDEMDEIITRFGKLLETPVYKRNILQTINTRGLNNREKYAVEGTLTELIKHIDTINGKTL